MMNHPHTENDSTICLWCASDCVCVCVCVCVVRLLCLYACRLCAYVCVWVCACVGVRVCVMPALEETVAFGL